MIISFTIILIVFQEDTLVKLIDKLPELRQKKEPQLIGYISATARNTAYNFLRAQKKIAPFSFEEYMQNQNQSLHIGKWRIY